MVCNLSLQCMKKIILYYIILYYIILYFIYVIELYWWILIDTCCTWSGGRIWPCLFLVPGMCGNKECPFLHIDPNKKIKDCPWYDRGYCRHGQYENLNQVVLIEHKCICFQHLEPCNQSCHSHLSRDMYLMSMLWGWTCTNSLCFSRTITCHIWWQHWESLETHDSWPNRHVKHRICLSMQPPNGGRNIDRLYPADVKVP